MNVQMTLYEIVNFMVSEPIRASLDIFSHIITGIMLANIFLKNKPLNERILIGSIAGFFPDFDFLLQMIGVMQHGTFTHTPLFLIPFILVGAFFAKKPFLNKSYLAFTKFFILCIILHIIADLGGNYFSQILYISAISFSYYVLGKLVIKKSEHKSTPLESD